MLLEWISFLRTRSSKIAKEWGFAYQNVSLKYRSERCKKAWQPHVRESRNLIEERVRAVKAKSVLILGSGLLLEIPIEFLLQNCDKIYLVDLVHAAQIRTLARKNPKIELIEKDISAVLGFIKKGQSPFQVSSIPWQHLPAWDLPKVDLAISANLMSQIPLIISESIAMSSSVYRDFSKKLRDEHIRRLLEQGTHALLFADFENRYIDREGNLLKTETYTVNLRELKYLKEWIWEIAPFGETSKDYKVEMTVKAYAN